MYMRDLADSLLRRWYFVVVALAITLGACFFASKSIPPTYQAQASVVLIPPRSADDPTANRFLSLSGLSQAADVLSRALNADKTHEQVHSTAPSGQFDVIEDGATSAPVLIITAKAPSADQATTLIDVVLKQVPVSLSTLQSSLSIARGSEITSIPLARDDKPTLSQKKRLRAIAALAILCLGGSTMVIGALDGMLLVRSRRKTIGLGEISGLTNRGPGVDENVPDGAWLENELATISSSVLDPHLPASPTKRGGRERPPVRERK